MAEFKKRLRRWFPTAQALEQTRGFGWLGQYLREHPRLWVLHRRGVALGVAAYLVVYRAWAVLIRAERRRRLERSPRS